MKQQVLQSMVFYPSGMPLKSRKYTEHDHIGSNKTMPMYARWMSKTLTIKLIKFLWYDVAFRNKIKMFHTLKMKEYNIILCNKFVVSEIHVLTGSPATITPNSKKSTCYTLECCIRWIFLYNLSFLVSSYDLFQRKNTVDDC